MYYFTGVQHKKNEDVVIPVLGYETKDGYLKKYHEEMSYAMNSEDFIGLTILVFDNVGASVLSDNWVKEVKEEPKKTETAGA